MLQAAVAEEYVPHAVAAADLDALEGHATAQARKGPAHPMAVLALAVAVAAPTVRTPRHPPGRVGRARDYVSHMAVQILTVVVVVRFARTLHHPLGLVER